MTQDARILAFPTRPRSTPRCPVTDRATSGPGTPVPSVQPNADRETRQPVTPVLITVAEVLLATAATHSTRVRRFWLDGLRKLRTARLQARNAGRSKPSRRGDYLEIAAMAREMHRL